MNNPIRRLALGTIGKSDLPAASRPTRRTVILADRILPLLRLYRVSGAHSAAAEQYAHYATYMREELGVEPLALDAL